jgi:hypothetical protein
MGGLNCCQSDGKVKEQKFEEHNLDGDNQDGSDIGRFRGGNMINSKSFLDVNSNNNIRNNEDGLTAKNNFLKCEVNLIKANKDNIDNIVPKDFISYVKDKSLIFNFEATLDEIILPVWIYANTTIKMTVIGSWNIFENENFFTSSGIQDIGSDITPYDLPVGALCGYIQGGDVFLIRGETSVISKNSGPLVLFQNNGEYDVKPNGSLLVIIEGAVEMPLEEIETFLGWDSKILEDINICNFMSEVEKNILYYLNKLRANPPLFAKLYLYHRKSKSKSDEECYEYLLTLNSIPLLKPNLDLYRAAKIHANDMASNNMTGHQSSNGKNLKDRLDNLNIDINKIGENCSYGISNALAIVLELLVDETESKGHRRNLLDSNFQIVGITLDKHPIWGVSCVQDFSKF